LFTSVFDLNSPQNYCWNNGILRESHIKRILPRVRLGNSQSIVVIDQHWGRGMQTFKRKIIELLILTIFFSGLITLVYSQEPKQCPSNGTWIDPHGFTTTCNVPDCYEAMGRISKWISLTLMVLIAYLAGLRAKSGLNANKALFRIGIYLTFISVVFASELSKVPEGSCLTLKPVAYAMAMTGSFLVIWFRGA